MQLIEGNGSYYLYDVNSNRIFKICEEIYKFLSNIVVNRNCDPRDPNVCSRIYLKYEELPINIREAIRTFGILQQPKVKKLKLPISHDRICDMLNN